MLVEDPTKFEVVSDLPTADELTSPVPHPDFLKAKQEAWDFFLKKDYENAARTAARMLQNGFVFDFIHLCGLSLTALDRKDEGFEWLCASLSLSSSRPDWYANAGIAMIEKKDYLKAMLFIQNGVKDFPEDIRLSYMRGLIMCHAQEWEQAVGFLDATLQLDPKFYHANMSKGFCFHMTGRYEEAIETYKSIYDQAGEPDREEVVNNHACVLMELGRQKEALALLDREYPNSTKPGTLYNRSFLYLGMGHWPMAWHMYRHRAVVQVNGDQGLPVVDQPTAQTLDDIKGKHLFLFHEQGLGDSLMFIRYAALVRPYVSKLTIGVPRTFERLARCLNLVTDFDVVPEANAKERDSVADSFDVVSDGDRDQPIFSRCETSLPMLDCPAIFNTTVDTIPSSVPYFTIPDEIIEQHRLPSTTKLRVGLVWAGSSRPENIRAHSIDKRRSIPFEIFKPILDLSDQFEFVSLQLPDNWVDDPRVIQPLSFGGDVPGERDLLDTAGVVKQLDLVISIDSAMAHLAGALAIPVWMLSRFDGCFRWLWPADEKDYFYHHTNFYKTMYIFRQTAHGTWPKVIEDVVTKLRTFTKD